MAEDTQRKIMGIINRIVEKSSDGNYIYRGEPECFTESPFDGKVSSSLWRQLQSTFTLHDRVNFDYDAIQESYVKDARQYDEKLHQDDFEAASQLQHVGGKTNLIDFTECHLVALFFACDGAPRKPGRVILLKQTEQMKEKYKIKKPQCPKNRVKAQKSVFVQHSSGIIDEDDIEEICIHRCFKKPILTYLRESEGIYAQKIYNDRHGYITRQENHRKAYSEYGRGLLSRRNNSVLIVEENGRAVDETWRLDTAIEHFSKAIEREPIFSEAYQARAQVYRRIGDFDKAIKDYTSAIEIDPDDASAYIERGRTYSNKGCYARAIENFNRAIEIDPDDASAYVGRGDAYSDKGCYARAIENFNRAIEIDPDDASAYVGRGEAYFNTGCYARAEQDYIRAIELGYPFDYVRSLRDHLLEAQARLNQ